jgi:uncharacterized protein
MLKVEIARIPPEGIEIDAPLSAESVHLESEGEFQLQETGHLRCRVDRGDDESVHVRGRLEASLRLHCGRCLEAFAHPVAQEVDLFYLPRPATPGRSEDGEEAVALSDRDLVVAFYSEEVLDLGEMVREQLFLALPMKRLCREGCRGLCPSCGKNRNRAACSCDEAEEIDPRLSPLKELLNRKR